MSETLFSNDNLSAATPEQLAMIQQLDLQTLSEKYAPLNLQINILSTLLITFLGVLTYLQPWLSLPQTLMQYLPLGLSLFALLGLGFCGMAYIADKRKRYALRELDLHFSSGLIFQKVLSQPITRIQHIELKRGPLERYKGLASLQVFSAGGAMHTFELPGLTLDTAEHIRQLILQHKDLAQHG